MKVKITLPMPELGYQAGLIYDLPEKLADELLLKGHAILPDMEREQIEITNLSDPQAVFVEGVKKKVKYDRKN